MQTYRPAPRPSALPICQAGGSSGASGSTGDAWIADFSGETLSVSRLGDVGRNPFDGVVTEDGQIYLVGLFGEKGVTAIDLWERNPTPVRFLKDYGKLSEDQPVFKMPHLQGWAFTGGQFVLPAVGRHELLWVERTSLEQTGRTPMHGQPVFIIAQPASPYVWVNFALPNNDTVQIVDSRSHEVVHTSEARSRGLAYGVCAPWS